MWQVFRGANVKLGNWRQVTVPSKNVYEKVETTCERKAIRNLPASGSLLKAGHTRRSVQSPLVVLNLKVRKGGDFFYGKSNNENHLKGV